MPVMIAVWELPARLEEALALGSSEAPRRLPVEKTDMARSSVTAVVAAP